MDRTTYLYRICAATRIRANFINTQKAPKAAASNAMKLEYQFFGNISPYNKEHTHTQFVCIWPVHTWSSCKPVNNQLGHEKSCNNAPRYQIGTVRKIQWTHFESLQSSAYNLLRACRAPLCCPCGIMVKCARLACQAAVSLLRIYYDMVFVCAPWARVLKSSCPLNTSVAICVFHNIDWWSHRSGWYNFWYDEHFRGKAADRKHIALSTQP